MPISMIVAVAENGAIGLEGRMPWHLSDDLKHFRKITMGHAVVMGRKTWEALPKKPLDGRQNIVLSQKLVPIEGAVVYGSVEELLQSAQMDEEIMVIGGATIYEQLLPHADKLYLTRVHADYQADTWFPELRMSEWLVIDSVYHPADEKHAVDFTFLTLLRKADA